TCRPSGNSSPAEYLAGSGMAPTLHGSQGQIAALARPMRNLECPLGEVPTMCTPLQDPGHQAKPSETAPPLAKPARHSAGRLAASAAYPRPPSGFAVCLPPLNQLMVKTKWGGRLMLSMRVTAGIAVCSALLAAMPAAAQEAGRPYINLGVGASFLEGLQAKGTGGGTLDLNQNPGPMAVIALGYALPANFRAEIEYGYRHNDAKNITLPSGATTPTALGLKANAMANSYMANLYYDFHPVWGLIPHIGAGVGAANVKVNNVGKDWPFAWQAMAGAEYPVSYNARVGAEYRFLGTEGMSFSATPTTESGHTNYYDHAVLINFRWVFGSPPPPPPPPAAAPAVYTPPPPAPAPP